MLVTRCPSQTVAKVPSIRTSEDLMMGAPVGCWPNWRPSRCWVSTVKARPLRPLVNRLVGPLHGCLTRQRHEDENVVWPGPHPLEA